MCRAGCILVVDDDPDIRETLRDYLEVMGCAVELAVDGVDALESLERCPRPCLVLLDINMPRMNGESFARTVRSHVTFCDLPIVSMSAGLVRLGPPEVHGHLDKPFDLALFEPSIEQYCRDR